MPNPSVLVIHNRYQQAGGEDTVVRAEIDLLRSRGHRVVLYERHNSEIAGYSYPRKLSLLFSTSWNRRSYSEIQALIRKHKPNLAHCHNFLPLISPSAYFACKDAGVPVVQTLHNYRLLCPAGTLFRGGQRCDRCERGSVHGVLRGCYRDSRLQTAAVSLMLGAHRYGKTWNQSVDAYVTPSQFCRDTFIRGGLPAQRIFCRSNFLATDPGRRTNRGDYALFVGRLTAEKGILEMLQAWRSLAHVPLVIVGDGPLCSQAGQMADRSSQIKLLGHLERNRTMALMKGARFLIFPSRWYEPFDMALIEAAACGVPAIASRIGAIPEIVADQQTGLLFDPDNLNEMVDHVRWAWSHANEMEDMGAAARTLYLKAFSADKSYESLMTVYQTIPQIKQDIATSQWSLSDC